MKKSLIYISAAMFATLGLSSCNDNWETPPLDAYYPHSNWKANETIDDLKTVNWKSDRNYVNTIGQDAEGNDIIIKGRVISESGSGNIYNSIVIQQENGDALNIAVRTNKLTTIPAFGQEILVNVSGMKIGGYNGLMQLGAEGTYNGQPSMTFMESADFEAKFEANGAPNKALVDTLVVTDLSELAAAKATDAGLIKWQSQLVRVENVTFKEQGVVYAGSQNTNRYVKDANGNELNVRTSSYATFKDALTPAGSGSVTGILSYYGTDWQLLLNDTTGVVGFEKVENPGTPDDPSKPDEPVTPPTGGGDGTEASPYTVAQVIAGATGTEVWTKGYIVGWVEGQKLEEGAHFDAANVSVVSNLLLAATPDVKDAKACVPVQLSSGTDVRTKLNLKDNPGVLGKEVAIKGNLEKYFGVAGIKSTTAYKMDGSADPDPEVPSEAVASINEGFDAGSIPAGWTQAQVAGNKTWYTPSYQDNYYAAMTGYKGTAPFDQWLFTPAVDMAKATDKVLSFVTQVNGYGSKTSKLEVYVLTAADPTSSKTQLTPTLATAPDSGYSSWVESGSIDLSSYSGIIYIGFRYVATEDANYATWCVDNVKVNVK